MAEISRHALTDLSNGGAGVVKGQKDGWSVILDVFWRKEGGEMGGRARLQKQDSCLKAPCKQRMPKV